MINPERKLKLKLIDWKSEEKNSWSAVQRKNTTHFGKLSVSSTLSYEEVCRSRLVLRCRVFIGSAGGTSSVSSPTPPPTSLSALNTLSCIIELDVIICSKLFLHDDVIDVAVEILSKEDSWPSTLNVSWLLIFKKFSFANRFRQACNEASDDVLLVAIELALTAFVRFSTNVPALTFDIDFCCCAPVDDTFVKVIDLLATVEDCWCCGCCSVDSRFAVTLCMLARIECIDTKPRGWNKSEIIWLDLIKLQASKI